MTSYSLKPLLYKLLLPVWRVVDFCTPKKADHWAFDTHHLHSERFIENQRAVFEQVKADPSLHKIIFIEANRQNGISKMPLTTAWYSTAVWRAFFYWRAVKWCF